MKALIFLLCLLVLLLAGCDPTKQVLPMQYKDPSITLNKKQVQEVHYSPVGNGVLSIETQLGRYDITLINFDIANALAAKLAIQPKERFELFDALFTAELPEDKKSIVNQVFATVKVNAVPEVSSATQKLYLAELVDNSFELYLVAMADDSAYCAIKGFDTLNAAKAFANRISLTVQ